MHQPAPPAPRLSSRLRALRSALEQESEVHLIYSGTEGTPATLPVIPRFMFERHGKAYLEAECLRSSTLKTYLLDRIRQVKAGSPQSRP